MGTSVPPELALSAGQKGKYSHPDLQLRLAAIPAPHPCTRLPALLSPQLLGLLGGSAARLAAIPRWCSEDRQGPGSPACLRRGFPAVGPAAHRWAGIAAAPSRVPRAGRSSSSSSFPPQPLWFSAASPRSLALRDPHVSCPPCCFSPSLPSAPQAMCSAPPAPHAAFFHLSPSCTAHIICPSISRRLGLQGFSNSGAPLGPSSAIHPRQWQNSHRLSRGRSKPLMAWEEVEAEQRSHACVQPTLLHSGTTPKPSWLQKSTFVWKHKCYQHEFPITEIQTHFLPYYHVP